MRARFDMTTMHFVAYSAIVLAVVGHAWLAHHDAKETVARLDAVSARSAESRDLLSAALRVNRMTCKRQDGSLVDLGEPTPCGQDSILRCVITPGHDRITVYEAQLRCEAGKL